MVPHFSTDKTAISIRFWDGASRLLELGEAILRNM